MSDRSESQASKKSASWKLMAVKTSLDGESEPIAVVRTPEGVRAVPLSEARGKVNLFEQMPETCKQMFIEKLYEGYRKWALEQESAQQSNPEDK